MHYELFGEDILIRREKSSLTDIPTSIFLYPNYIYIQTILYFYIQTKPNRQALSTENSMFIQLWKKNIYYLLFNTVHIKCELHI